MKIGHIFQVTMAMAAALLSGGCGMGDNNDSNVTLAVRVSSLHYIADANVTLDGNQSADYISTGDYYFYTTPVRGERMASGGYYITNGYDESNTSIAPTTCPQFDTNATALPVLSAPGNDAGVAYETIYINITPFTSLLAEGNMTVEEMINEFPTAYQVQEDVGKTVINFDFDVTAARPYYYSSDANLTSEICEALHRLNQIQGIYP